MPANAVLLAAGLSQRMGQPKQTLRLGGLPLCAYAARSMSQARYNTRWAVVPDNDLGDQIAAALSVFHFQFIRHPAPELGLASSFRLAAQSIPDQDTVFVLADMPFVSPETHHALVLATAPIVLVKYGETHAPPARFAASFLPEIRTLADNDHGPRELLSQHSQQIQYIQRPVRELMDIDTPADWKKAQFG